ncbi:MAG: hypothetical protein J0G32_08055 [Alphaproteobacteria bacterium]|nr:hypothetical protein [Alphaproteobacteria bacterium]OJV15998.1 MAG: hypothetical protein BGO27_04030 [Alphaproteobacteria bacterium 33-17]
MSRRQIEDCEKELHQIKQSGREIHSDLARAGQLLGSMQKTIDEIKNPSSSKPKSRIIPACNTI